MSHPADHSRSLHQAFTAARMRAGPRPFLAESAVSGGRVWSFEEAGREVDDLIHIYAHQGWGHGHRVALAVGNHPRHFFHFLALNHLGASIVPLNPDHRGGEIRHAMSLSGAQLVVAMEPRWSELNAALQEDGALAHMAVLDASQLAQQLPAAPPGVAALSEDPWQREVAVLFTSGTSGPPKGCVLTNEYMMTAGAWYRDLGGALTLRHAQERLLNPLPVFHMNCGITSIATMCLSDNCLVLPDRFHASTWWEDCVQSQATAIHYLGIMPPVLFKQSPTLAERQHQIRFGLGAGCEPSLHPQVEARFGFPFVEVWGMTETGRFLSNQHEPRHTSTRAFGRAAEPVQVRVVDDQDREVPQGQPGQLLVRASGSDPRRGFFSGYLGQPQDTEHAWRGGWFHTGDVVTQDADGMLYFVDRRKDIIRRSGENISAAEVEAVLAAHPAVARVAVMAVPDEWRDEEVLATVVLAPGQLAHESLAQSLQAHCLELLAYYKAPAWWVFRDSLPVTATNKVAKNLIFASGEDPRAQGLDLRAFKKRPTP
jgi:acyl-CoA synthetase (AMP-forming)/AMP-acid ligase II